MPDHDKRERKRIHPVDVEAEHVESNDHLEGGGSAKTNFRTRIGSSLQTHAPEVSCQERDIEESRACQTVQDRHKNVEEGQNESVTGEVACHLAVPGCDLEAVAIKDCCLTPIPQAAPESQLTNHLVQRSLADKVLFGDIAQTVERCTCKCE